MNVPAIGTYILPNDITLRLPDKVDVASKDQHFLLYLEWSDKYRARIPPKDLKFFNFVLPHLNARTTNVHCAVCLPFVDELIADTPKSIDRVVVSTAFILHDCGWIKLSQAEIAQSLGVTGLKLTASAKDPKLKHALLGLKLAAQLIDTFSFDPPLNKSQRQLILDAVRFHDQPEHLAQNGAIPLEVKVVCDVDHLWSFTHLNFWQDIVRKGVDPQTYVKNLASDLDDYFVTPQGKAKAQVLLRERQAEVKEWLTIKSV